MRASISTRFVAVIGISPPASREVSPDPLRAASCKWTNLRTDAQFLEHGRRVGPERPRDAGGSAQRTCTEFGRHPDAARALPGEGLAHDVAQRERHEAAARAVRGPGRERGLDAG